MLGQAQWWVGVASSWTYSRQGGNGCLVSGCQLKHYYFQEPSLNPSIINLCGGAHLSARWRLWSLEKLPPRHFLDLWEEHLWACWWWKMDGLMWHSAGTEYWSSVVFGEVSAYCGIELELPLSLNNTTESHDMSPHALMLEQLIMGIYELSSSLQFVGHSPVQMGVCFKMQQQPIITARNWYRSCWKLV